MKYVMFMADDEEIRSGIISGETIEETENIFDNEGEIIKTGNTFELRSVILLCPTYPTKALCVGLNYKDHIEEMKLVTPTSPVIFMKPSTAALDPEGEIIRPEMSSRVDYEAELAVVIKKECRNVSEAEAKDYILGYTCANDVTARDLQDKNGQWTVCKGFDTFMPLGPYISDEVDPTNLKIESRLNGKVMQKSNTKNLLFTCDYLVSYLSKVMTLLPGDVILTGTPSGIHGMEAGDVIEIEIEGLGILRNTVI
ncbi:MAG: fumarylacetoacetate hydrolase family protein [Bullifex sp.]|nr:fumarylacetoacetate hydrolase family protein [Spirochaetales bacterium]MDY2816680.1 fumarylacetoacetate hydrolase family protein [Bullifex sp.]MDD7009333.1 fumarylacetoacetate hydrolase family protein [Spirochaetales bacterium]MDD7536389.1 fumarylacetoacetate hydrolase family protein [Spirochaetales bacterium]MDY3850108.1 fumarylacetoacetate hydrolase family protein [Bullifex sp.]